MEKINIEEILEKHLGKFQGKTFSDRFRLFYMTHDPQVAERRIKWAIKEIVEAVVDKCAEEAETKLEIDFDGEKHYDYNVIDKQSILKVKEMFDYE